MPSWMPAVLNSVVDIDNVSAAGFMLWISGHTIMAVPTTPVATVV